MKTGVSEKKRNVEWYVSGIIKIALALLPSFVMTVEHYASAVLALGVVGALILVRKNDFKDLDKSLWIMSAAFVGMFLASVMQWLVSAEPLLEFKGWEHGMRFLLFIPLVLVLIRLGLSERFFLLSAVWGSIFMGLYASVCFWITGERVEGVRDAVVFGGISLLFGCLSFLGMRFFSGRRRLVLLSFAGGFMGLLASFLSGTRGAWIAVPFLFVIVVRYLLSQEGSKKLGLLFIVALIVGLVFGGRSELVQDRVELAIQQYSDYRSNPELYSSVGARLGMWKKVVDEFPQHPILGRGYGSFAYEKKEEQGGELVTVMVHKHPHNVFLSYLYKGGLAGLGFLVFLFGGSFLLFVGNWKKSPMISTAGQLIVLGYIFSGLTNDSLFNGVSISLYVALIAWCAAIASALSTAKH